MGLDVHIYGGDDNQNLLLYLRNHWDFHDLFAEQVTGGGMEPESSDFYVDESMLSVVDDKICQEMRAEGLPLDPYEGEPPEGFECDEPESLAESHPVYRKLVADLMDKVREHGSLTYSWSA